jgi:hypothetical protein
VALFKTRPEIALYAPRTLSPGDSLEARVVLRCAEPVPVDELTLELVGNGVWFTSSQHGQHRNERSVVRLVGRPLTSRAELPAGEHEYRVSFAVPRDAPPSFSGGFLKIEWEFRVRASIPWWPDAKATFVAHVAPRPSASTPSGPRVYASNVEGPQGTKPYAEVSLGDAISGQPLEGTVALSNTAYNDYRAVELRLTSRETVPSLFNPHTVTNKHSTWRVPLSSPGENELIRFRLQLPHMVPGFETNQLGLEWVLEIRLCLAWALDARLWVPLSVQSRAVTDTSEASAPLAVGNDRLASVWRQAGRDSGFNYRDGQLSRECGAARLVIRREHRGRRGLRLVAEALYPDLDLGLKDEQGHLRCRDSAQAEVLAAHTDARLSSLSLENADDQRLLCVVDDPGTRHKPVADLAAAFVELWNAFEDAREELPAPADMADAVSEFRAAARRLGGELDVASMDIRGSRHEIPFALEVQWEGDELARTVLEVRPTLPIDGRWHHSGEIESAPSLPEGVAELTDGVRSLLIDRERIRLVFPPCGRDVHPMADRVEALLDVARRLSGQGAGYR